MAVTAKKCAEFSRQRTGGDVVGTFLPEDKGPHALTPNTVELIPTLEPFPPEAGPSRTHR